MTVQEKGWMEEKLMIRWIKDIYLKYTKKGRSLLVLDSFRGHLTDSVKKICRKGNTVMAVILGNHWTSESQQTVQGRVTTVVGCLHACCVQSCTREKRACQSCDERRSCWVAALKE